MSMGEWPSGLKCCDQNWKVPGSNPARHSAELRDQPHYQAPSDLQVDIDKTQ